MDPQLANAVVALIAVGMGVAFYLADRDSPTSRALALFMTSMGLAISGVEVVEAVRGQPNPGWFEWLDLGFETLAFLTGFEWGLRVSRTVPGPPESHRRGERIVRAAQVLVVVYAVLAAVFPDQRAAGFGTGGAGADLGQPWFYVFAAPLILAALLILAATALLVGQRPDAAESVRVLSLTCAGPFLAAALVLPNVLVPFSVAVGELIFLIGAIRYHVMQGERGQFLARFMSPDVVELVRERGIANAMRTERRRLSVVACDIRGFTPFARRLPPDRVMQVLREYYQGVGAQVMAQGATIKDQAGDGVLILVGAPIAHADHAARALALAQAIRTHVRTALQARSDPATPLGLGVGVATGEVAVGVIGDAARLEYTAVGPAVNLAARLCEQAADGEIRVDAETWRMLGEGTDLRPLEPLALKGFDEPVPSFLA